MWPRVIEVSLAVWLALSPFIFRDSIDRVTELICYGAALVIAGLAVVCYWPPARRAHLWILVVALAIAAWGRFAEGTPPPAAHQNLIAVGLLLLMFAVIPSDCLRPPLAWRTQEEGS